MSQEQPRGTSMGGSAHLPEESASGGWIRGLAVRVLGRTVYRRLLLLERCAGPVGNGVPPGAGLEWVSLRPGEAEEYVAVRLEGGAEGWPGTQGWRVDPTVLVRQRLASGAECVLVREEGRIVASCWVLREATWIGYLGCGVDVGTDGVCLFDLHTRRDMRSRGIARDLVGGIAGSFRTQDVRRLVAAVWPENVASLRSLEGAGFRVGGRIGYVGLGPWRRHFCEGAGFRVRRFNRRVE